MCSGARSSSANGAMAARAAPACSWSTSSSTVLSDCTINGPSVNGVAPFPRKWVVPPHRSLCLVAGAGHVIHYRPLADTTDVMRWMAKSRSRPDAESKATSWPPRMVIGDTTRWVATPAASR